MLNAYITTTQTVPVNGILEFDLNKFQTNCSASHVAGSGTIQLNQPGYYFVDFKASASATAAATTPITVQLLSSGIVEVGAISSALSTAEDTPVGLGFSTIVEVRPNCCAIDNTKVLTIQNIGVEAEFTNASLVVIKL